MATAREPSRIAHEVLPLVARTRQVSLTAAIQLL